MDKLYGWSIKRAGSGMTIGHRSGKVTAIGSVTIENGKIIATRSAEVTVSPVPRQFELVVS